MPPEKIRVCPTRCKALVIGNSTYKSVYDFGVTPQDLEKAFRELNEKEDEREASILKLKEKLKRNSELRFLDDDEYLLCYLRFRKFDIDRAYSTLRKAYSIRKQNPELFCLPPNLESLYNIGVINLLPYTDQKGRLVYWINFGKWKPEDVSLYEILQINFAMMDLATMNPCCQIHGIAEVWNFKGFAPTARWMASLLNPRLLRVLATLLQDCFPERIKLLVFINCHTWVRRLFNSVKFLLSKKVANRILVFDTDATVLPEFFSPAILPKELGGMIEDDRCIVTDYVKDNLPYLKYIRSLATVSDELSD